jgi:ankyrin repeat protein
VECEVIMFDYPLQKTNRYLMVMLLLLTSGYIKADSYSIYKESELVASSKQEQQWQELTEYFFAAARLGDIVVIDEFIEAGFPIDIRNNKGYSALMISAYNGRPEAVNRLLVLGSNACAEDNRGNTAIMAAIFKGELRIAKRLIKADCNEDHQNNAGQTPLMYASVFGRKELQALLINRGADENKTDHNGNTAASIRDYNY